MVFLHVLFATFFHVSWVTLPLVVGETCPADRGVHFRSGELYSSAQRAILKKYGDQTEAPQTSYVYVYVCIYICICICCGMSTIGSEAPFLNQ